MLDFLSPRRLLARRPVALVAPSAAPSDLDRARDLERAASSEILLQAQWLYEQHERRVQNCQNMAVAILTVAGTIMALAPSVLPESASLWQFVALAVVAIAGLGTMVQCMRVLAPRVRLNGLPSVEALREFAHNNETLTPAKVPIPVSQFAVDLLNPLRLTEPSPLSQSSADAKRRTSALVHAYWWFSMTFVLVIAMSAVFATVR